MRYSIEAIANKLNISESEVNHLLDTKKIQESMSVKEYEGFLENIYQTISNFLHNNIETPLIIEALSTIVSFKNQKLSLIEICQIQDSKVKFSFLDKVIKDISRKAFKQQSLKKRNILINKEITELLFNFPVDAVWVNTYSDTGDSQKLALRYRTEIYSDGSGECWEDLKDYSTNMAHAWEIVEYLAKLGISVRLSNKSFGNEYWWCYIDESNFTAQSDTACLAICEAALMYVKQKDKK